MSAQTARGIVEHLARSPLYRGYERAFGDATGLPLSLAPAESWQLAHHGRKHENPFCALMARRSKSCAACLRAQHELTACGAGDAHTVTCFAGLCESSVPIRNGEKIFGYLRTGEVATHPLSRTQFAKLARQLRAWGIQTGLEEIRHAWFATRVVTAQQYRSALELLKIFAEHLALVAGQLVLRSANSEPPAITSARHFIEEHKAGPLTLRQVAASAHMSSFYFCKKFKKTTGLTFTEYLARVRVEAAKKRLLNPQARISEVAFEVGFQSITHFNRVFKELVGQCPTEYRTAAPQAA